MVRKLILGLGVVLASVLTGTSVQASLLTFDQVVNTGSLTYDGVLGHPLVGTNISFTTIRGTDTPLNDGVSIACTGCFLNFSTGGSTLEGPPTWDFAAGGIYTLTGSILGNPSSTIIREFTDSSPPCLTQAEFFSPALALTQKIRLYWLFWSLNDRLIANTGITGAKLFCANFRLTCDQCRLTNTPQSELATVAGLGSGWRYRTPARAA
jgi:hypothetical protein